MFLKNNRSVTLIQRELRRRFLDRMALTRLTLRHLTTGFEGTGSTWYNDRHDRPWSNRSLENIATVATNIQEIPQTSTRRRTIGHHM